MQLTPTGRDRLLLFTAAELARRRRARGLLLNVPEATALVADTVAEAARDGLRLADAITAGRTVLRPEEVLPGVADVVRQVEVEAVFDDGTRLAVVPAPFGPPGHSLSSPGAVLAGPAGRAVDGAGDGAVDGAADAVDRMPPRPDVVEVSVTNESPVPISVTSHFHFFEVNPRLRFDRAAAWGRRLAVPAGAVRRFDPGMPVQVGLVPIGGARVVIGFAGLVDGPLDAPGALASGLERARACGYLDAADTDAADTDAADTDAGKGTP